MPQGSPVLSVLGEFVVDLIPDPTADAGPEGTAPHYIARPGGNALNVAVAAGRLGATRASATLFLIPIVALVLGVAVRGEQVAPLSVAGAAVCLIGAWLIRRPAPAAAVDPSAQPIAAIGLSVADRTITVSPRQC